MKSKSHSLAVQHEILVETQLQNATPRGLFLQSVAFAPAPQFEVVPLTTFEEGGAPAAGYEVDGLGRASSVGLPPSGHMAYLKAGDTQQYMCARPPPSRRPAPPPPTPLSPPAATPLPLIALSPRCRAGIGCVGGRARRRCAR